MDVILPQRKDRSDRVRAARPRGRSLGTLVGLALLVGCGGGPGPAHDGPAPRPVAPSLWPDAAGGVAPRRTGCGVLAGPAQHGAALTVVVTDSVLVARAPIPANAAERWVFAQLYETLVRVDCGGAVQAGLASHWSCTADSTVWIFSLRPDARFWDGTPVTAEDVRAAWRDGALRRRDTTRAAPWDWLDARVGTVEPLDARRLKIQLPEPQADLPSLLAHAATAVAVRRPGWTWPVGSGPARLRAATPAPRPDLVCRPNPQHPQAPVWAELVFQVQPGRDLRDLVGAGFDLAAARDLAVVEFYADAPGYQVDALPWDRLYLLVCPPETNPGGAGRWFAAADRLDPARSVTTVSARSWSGIVFPAGGRHDCPQMAGPVAAGGALRRDSDLARTPVDAATLVYAGDDPGARELAGRLAALAGSGVRTVPLEAASVAASLRWQMPGAVILPQDQQYPTACLQLASLLGQAQWLQDAALRPDRAAARESLVAADRASAGSAQPADALQAAELVRPLLLSRAWLVTRGNLAGLTLDFDGTPRLAQTGPAEQPGDTQP